MEIPIIIASIAAAAPRLAVWIAAIILSAIVLRRNGGKAERLLLAGVVLMLASTLFDIPSSVIVPLAIGRGDTITLVSSISRIYEFLLGIIDMAGIICMVYGFWVKFRAASAANL